MEEITRKIGNMKTAWLFVTLVVSLFSTGCHRETETPSVDGSSSVQETSRPELRQTGSPTDAAISVQGGVIHAKFSDVVLHLTGEFSGNLDFAVTFAEPVTAKKALANLRVQMPGHRKLIGVAGCREIPGGLKVTIYTELAPPGHDVPQSAAPSSADVFWLEESSNNPAARLSFSAPN